MGLSVQDHYSTLGVPPEASQKEIKSAFRKKAKLSHPDRTGRADEPMRLLLEAYRVLSDPRSRREYDRGRLRLVKAEDRGSFDYRAWLKERLDDPEYVAKLVIYDLLHGFEDEAISLYDGVRDRDDARLERFFERPEAMDAEFCLAEEYAARGRFQEAYAVLTKLVAMEQKAPGFGYFYDVVLARFRRLVLEELGRSLEDQAELELLRGAIALKSSPDNDAQFWRRAAELLIRQGKARESAEAIARAAALKPRMPGLRALSKRVGDLSRLRAPR